MKKMVPGVALMVFSAAALADDPFSLSTGFDFSSGTYGNAQSTQILYIPVTAKYQSDDWTLKLTVPYIQISGPGGVIQGFGRITTTSTTSTSGPRFGRNTGGASSVNSGLGDIVASADRTVYTGDALTLDLVGKVKFGTADPNKGLGTGQNDYSGQVDATYVVSGATSLLATAGYKIVGAPVGVTVNNVAFGSLGLDQKTSDTTNMGVMFDYVQKVTAVGYDQKDATLYLSEKLSSGLKLQGYVLKGFTYGSPNYGVGGSITGRF